MIKSDFALDLKNALLFNKKDAVVLTEDKDDADFWQGIFARFAPQLKLEFYTGTLPLEDNKNATGRKAVLAYQNFTDTQFLLCVDSDYHYLLEDDTITSSFVFQTYVYAIENYQCFAPSLKQICREVAQTEDETIDFEDFLQRYSEIIYDLFVISSLDTAEIEAIWNIISLKGYFDVADKGKKELKMLKEIVEKKYHEVKIRFLESDISTQKIHFEQKGLLPKDTYLFIRGKNLKNAVVVPLLKSVIDRLKSQRLKDLRQSLSHDDFEKQRQILENQVRNLPRIIAQNTDYYDCFLIPRINNDIQKFIALKNTTP